VKGSFLNEQVRLDLAVFSADYDNFQLNTFNGTNFTVSNIGEVNSIGFEAEGAAVVTDQLTLTGGIAYTDAKYASDLFDPTDPTVAQIAGEQLTNAPEWILTTAADFEQPITSSLLLSIHLDMRFVDDHNTGSDLDPAKKQNSYYLWNGNVGIGADDGFWEVELWAKNLFNKDYKQVVIDAPLQGTDPSNQTYAAFLGDPRTWGVRARVNF
jgi:outer membrane receptor protein involved in Fe transport